MHAGHYEPSEESGIATTRIAAPEEPAQRANYRNRACNSTQARAALCAAQAGSVLFDQAPSAIPAAVRVD